MGRPCGPARHSHILTRLLVRNSATYLFPINLIGSNKPNFKSFAPALSIHFDGTDFATWKALIGDFL